MLNSFSLAVILFFRSVNVAGEFEPPSASSYVLSMSPAQTPPIENINNTKTSPIMYLFIISTIFFN